MALLTIAQLRASVTRAQATQTLLDLLSQLGFSATSWQSGSVQRTIVEMMGEVYSTMSEAKASLVDYCFNDTSSGAGLTEFSDSQYDNQRIVALAAQHTITLTCTAAEGPHAVSIGDLVVTDGTCTFRNITAGSVLSGSTLNLTFEAEVAGGDGNVAHSTITTLSTPLAGVTCTNPDLGTGSSITLAGQDEETDATLKIRNSTKWASLSIETPADGYEYIALSAVSNLRVDVDDSNPHGPGTVDVYIAKATGVATGTEEALVQTAMDARIMGGLHDAVVATSDTINFVFTVYYDSVYVAATVETACETAIAAYVNGAPIGGYDYTPGPADVLLYNEMVKAIEDVDGVSTVVMTTPSADFSVTAHHVAIVGTITDTYTPVS